MQRQFLLKSHTFSHQIEVDNNTLTFSIDQMKCRTVAVVYFNLYARNMEEELIGDAPIYTGKRWVVSDKFRSFYETFELSDAIIKQIKCLQVELVLINVNVNNPLAFTGVRLANGEYDGVYHVSDDSNVVHSIEFVDMGYVNLYSTMNDSYLQVIKPTKTSFTTKEIKRDKYTILAPHLVGESKLDNPTNLFVEVINQNEQETNIYNSGFKV